MDTLEIIKLIKESKKITHSKTFLYGKLNKIDFCDVEFIGSESFGVIIGDLEKTKRVLHEYSDYIDKFHIEVLSRNSAIPLADLTKYNARIEPGVTIRDMVEIGNNSVIMMGAIINIGAVIGEGTMIDMNVVIGGRAMIGKNCHIGAGTVLAGVIEPPSADPVIVEDNVLIGANAVVLEGVKIGKNSVVAAGAVVTKDIPENSVAAGIPAKVIKVIDDKTRSKTQIVNDLREL